MTTQREPNTVESLLGTINKMQLIYRQTCDSRDALRRELARLEDAIEKASHESYDECCWQELQKLLGLGWKGKEGDL